MMLRPEDLPALQEAAARLGVSAVHLAAVIDFETAGTWRPTIRNPYGSARGLLQWTDATARRMGYRDSEDLVTRHPTVAAQLRGPVVAYLAPFAPFPTLQSLALAVFYPALRFADPGTVFPENVRRVNPGIVRVADYVRRVEARISRVAIAAGGLAVVGVLAAIGLALFLTR